MALVAAKCTQCGATLQVDETKEAGICQYCDTAFMTEKVINNYNVTNNIKVENATINISGANIDNLLVRAMEYEQNGDIKEAKRYYNRILDIDAYHEVAKSRLANLDLFYIGDTSITHAQMKQIDSLIKENQKLEAIKQVRLLSGLDLKASKKYVDDFYTIDKTKPQLIPKGKTSGGCYVATAIYGSYDCPQVWTLRRFRDYTLKATWYGRTFIQIYYAVSPSLVKWFGHTKWFTKLWKGKLDKFVAKLWQNGFDATPYEDK